MANHVYRVFTSEDLFSTTIMTEPSVTVWSGSAGYGGDTNYPSATLSLYGGVRSRSDVGPSASVSSGLEIYPLTEVETHTIDGKIGVPAPYPWTGSVRFFYCLDYPQDALLGLTASDEMYYEEHHSTIRRLSQWYHDHYKHTYPAASTFGTVFTGWHIPQMFYHRQIATGSVLLTVNAFIGAPLYASSGSLYWRDDGYGRLWQVTSPTSSWREQGATQVSGVVLYNEGLVVFNHPDPNWHSRMAYGENIEPHNKLQFRSVNPIKSMVFLCRMAPGEVNASNNPTYYVTDETGKRWAHDWATSNESVTYITSIGLYNEDRQLVGVAKIAQPIRKRERDAIDIRLRLDV